MGTVNVNSLMNKLSYVHSLLCNNSLSLLVVCETWLTEGTSSSFVSLPDYKFFRRDVEGIVKKHGVGVYVKNSLEVVLDEVDIPNLLSIHLVSWDVHVVAVYRPPSYSVSENEVLLNFISDFCSTRTVLLLGDFNLPSIKWSLHEPEDGYLTPLDRMFFDMFLLMGLNQCVHEGTFFPSGNVLDLVFSSESESVLDFFVLPPLPNCYHSPVIIQYVVPLQLPKDVININTRMWYKGNYQDMNEELCVFDWDAEFEDMSVDECFKRFLEILGVLVSKYVPSRESDCSKKPSWLFPPPRSFMRLRTSAWNDFKQLRSRLGRQSAAVVSAWEKYSSINREYRNYSLNKQWEHELRLAKDLSKMPKLFHGYIRRKKKGKPPIGPLRVNNGVISDPEDMGEVLVDSFASVFVSGSPGNPSAHQRCEEQMEPMQVSYNAVFHFLSDLDPNSAAGPDGIHPQLLKACAPVIAYPLFIIFMRSLFSGDLPVVWKHCRYAPI